MASDVEDEELMSLRSAVLASLKPKSSSPSIASDVEEDDDLEALRIAALHSKKQQQRLQHSLRLKKGNRQIDLSEDNSQNKNSNLITIPLQSFIEPEALQKPSVIVPIKAATSLVRNDKFSRFVSESEESEDDLIDSGKDSESDKESSSKSDDEDIEMSTSHATDDYSVDVSPSNSEDEDNSGKELQENSSEKENEKGSSESERPEESSSEEDGTVNEQDDDDDDDVEPLKSSEMINSTAPDDFVVCEKAAVTHAASDNNVQSDKHCFSLTTSSRNSLPTWSSRDLSSPIRSSTNSSTPRSSRDKSLPTKSSRNSLPTKTNEDRFPTTNSSPKISNRDRSPPAKFSRNFLPTRSSIKQSLPTKSSRNSSPTRTNRNRSPPIKSSRNYTLPMRPNRGCSASARSADRSDISTRPSRDTYLQSRDIGNCLPASGQKRSSILSIKSSSPSSQPGQSGKDVETLPNILEQRREKFNNNAIHYKKQTKISLKSTGFFDQKKKSYRTCKIQSDSTSDTDSDSSSSSDLSSRESSSNEGTIPLEDSETDSEGEVTRFKQTGTTERKDDFRTKRRVIKDNVTGWTNRERPYRDKDPNSGMRSRDNFHHSQNPRSHRFDINSHRSRPRSCRSRQRSYSPQRNRGRSRSPRKKRYSSPKRAFTVHQRSSSKKKSSLCPSPKKEKLLSRHQKHRDSPKADIHRNLSPKNRTQHTHKSGPKKYKCGSSSPQMSATSQIEQSHLKCSQSNSESVSSSQPVRTVVSSIVKISSKTESPSIITEVDDTAIEKQDKKLKSTARTSLLDVEKDDNFRDYDNHKQVQRSENRDVSKSENRRTSPQIQITFCGEGESKRVSVYNRLGVSGKETLQRNNNNANFASVKARLGPQVSADQRNVTVDNSEITENLKSKAAVKRTSDEMLSDSELIKKKKRYNIWSRREDVRQVESKDIILAQVEKKEERRPPKELKMPDRDKSSEDALEARIERIKAKNAAILKRQQEIEADKQKYG